MTVAEKYLYTPTYLKISANISLIAAGLALISAYIIQDTMLAVKATLTTLFWTAQFILVTQEVKKE